jgi:hypothetical protein
MAYGSKAAARRQSTAKPSTPQFMPVPPVQAKPTAQPTELPDIELDPSNYQIDLANPLGNMYGHPPAAPPPVQPKPMGNATHHTPAIAPPPQAETVQREGMEEEEEALQMQPLVQRVGTEGGAVSDEFEQQLQSAKGSGQALDADLQQSMGQAMGADFSGVKVHTDAQSDQLNESIQSKAFTTGADVFFRVGEYDPGSKGGQELIAHELTHVVQQGGAGQGVQRQADEAIQRKIYSDKGHKQQMLPKKANKHLQDVGIPANIADPLTKYYGDKDVKDISLGELVKAAKQAANREAAAAQNEAEEDQDLNEKYWQLYISRKTKYFTLQNDEIPDYMDRVALAEDKPEYAGMTSADLIEKCIYVKNKALIPNHWASGYDPSRLFGGMNNLGSLTPVFYPEDLPKEGGKVYRADKRPPWDSTMKSGITSWAASGNRTEYSGDILRHVANDPSPTDSVYISTSFTTNIFGNFDGFRYYMKLPAVGINIRKHFSTSFSDREQELSVTEIIPIENVYDVNFKGGKKPAKGQAKKHLQTVIKGGLWSDPVRKLWPDWKKGSTESQYYDSFTWKDYVLNIGSLEEEIHKETKEAQKERESQAKEAYEKEGKEFFTEGVEGKYDDYDPYVKAYEEYSDKLAESQKTAELEGKNYTNDEFYQLLDGLGIVKKVIGKGKGVKRVHISPLFRDLRKNKVSKITVNNIVIDIDQPKKEWTPKMVEVMEKCIASKQQGQ